MNIVGIQQQDRMVRENIHELDEGFLFFVVSHDPGVRLRAVGGYAK